MNGIRIWKPGPSTRACTPTLVPQRDGAAVGHLPSEPPALQDDDLVAPGDGEGLGQDDQEE